ncbi:fus1 actin binding activity protein [Pleurotus ostreatus]|nr:fus1 actin binding activity protein [Pleurotus ostreatus]
MSPVVLYHSRHETRSPLLAREESTVSMPTSQVPVVVGATVAVIVVLVAIIVGILLAWRYTVRNRKKREAAEKATSREAKEDVFAAHPPNPILRPYIPPAESGVTWVPQLRADNTKALPSPSLEAVEVKEKDLAEQISNAAMKQLNSLQSSPESSPESSPDHTPEPSPQPLRSRFSVASPVEESVEIHLPNKPKRRTAASLPPTPATPFLTVAFSVEKPETSVSTFPPTPSPRSESFQNIDVPSRHSVALKGKNRQMVVVHTFEPERDDELGVEIGETLTLVQEFQDGWCLVQRQGQDAPKGVVPRFCIQDQNRPTLLQVPE